MALKIKETRVTAAQRAEIEDRISSLPAVTEVLKEADLEEVRRMIRVEADTKRRLSTLQRLVARFNVLEAKSNEDEVMQYVAHASKGQEK